MQDITSKYEVVIYVEEWNTDLISSRRVMSQAAQDLNDGEPRHESREAQAHEREEVQWTKHASRSVASSTA